VTSHLSPAEDIDALDGTLSSDRKAHLDEVLELFVARLQAFLERGVTPAHAGGDRSLAHQ